MCLSLTRFHQAQATSSSPPGGRVQIPSKYVADMSSYPIVIFSLFWFSLHRAVLSNTPLGVPNIEKLSHVEKDEKNNLTAGNVPGKPMSTFSSVADWPTFMGHELCD